MLASLFMTQREATGTGEFSGFMLGILAGVTAYFYSRRERRKPLDLQIEAAGREITECERNLPLAKERASELQQELDSFASWQSKARATSQT